MTGQVARVVGRDPGTGRLVEVLVDDGVVAQVRALGAEASSEPGGEPWLVPGLVDLQVNGFAGLDVNGPDVTPDVVVELVRALARAGTTTFVPTVVTSAESDLLRSLRAVAEARRRDDGARHAIPFVHLEGPHISAEDGPRGVHPAEHVREPDPAELRRWQEAADGLVGLVTISPHWDASTAYVRHAVASGVRIAIGHTHATPEQVHEAAAAGASLATHLGNGAHAVLPRHPNYVWAQLADDRLTGCFIADGHHLPADTLTAMLRAKGPDRAVLVSDSVALAGLPPGEYTTPVGGRVHLSADGRLSEVGTPFLAGAARTLADGVAGAARLAGLDLAGALRLATTNPGRVVGGRGVLTPGAPADVLLVDHEPGADSLGVRDVVVGGVRIGRGPVGAA
ncbi:N-acetylglucosamine-6-phosphate deacetylase [Beutenbergia cavernae DSM 12333]|uniref:N-acetylglucosamine-6-phosphate deacetylase n=1 Tax=Beutenbergia cavernae (strain ATCC BAA-8 / DSM 12333 / CCUG 43141 / JCM 11478 / NBRC 16432 / NCIMB 13614 / HKI 0122) TaxID=471853 RepID=C5C1I5_BEUC1|nr:amidohydrolase family protein [Beutenbergia cavernae]ACQ81595.1 N-acetylglucosamine-6-phosphate deacetylase [Beutenbergia cavernae DSM 12333]